MHERLSHESPRQLATSARTRPPAPRALVRPAARVSIHSTRSPRFRDFLDSLADCTPFDSEPVLLLGETGTGKTTVARHLHLSSARAHQRFVERSVPTLPESLAIAELFGHEAGAFTSADRPRAGAFEHAEGGTIFLDEIGHAGHQLQGQLLHAAEGRELQRLGTNEGRRFDVRMVTATSRDLEDDARSGRFLPDLLERIRTFTLRVPALRERPEDIPDLAAGFLELQWRKHPIGDAPPRIHDDLMGLLVRSTWPGNLRELARAVVNLYATARGNPVLTPRHCRGEYTYLNPVGRRLASYSLAELERMRAEHGGNNAALARTIGVTRTTVSDRLKFLRDRAESHS
jgi:two-component system response regulator HydG